MYAIEKRPGRRAVECLDHSNATSLSPLESDVSLKEMPLPKTPLEGAPVFICTKGTLLTSSSFAWSATTCLKLCNGHLLAQGFEPI